MNDEDRILTVPEEVKAYQRRLVTGNEWVSLPDIDPATGGLQSVNVLHMGLGGLWEFLGRADAALLGPVVAAEGGTIDLRGQIAWNLEAGWLPRGKASWATQGLETSIDILAPPGVRGFLVRIAVRNLASRSLTVETGLQGMLAGCRRTVYTSRSLDTRIDVYGDRWTRGFVLEASAGAAGAAMAVATVRPAANSWAKVLADWSRETALEWTQEPVAAGSGTGVAYRSVVKHLLPPGAEEVSVFAVGVGKDGDGARTSAVDMLRHGWEHWYRLAQEAWALPVSKEVSRRWEYATGSEGLAAALENVFRRNLWFNFYYSRGYTIDTEDLVLVTSRSPHYYVSAAFWARDAFLWSLPGLVLADPAAAREALVVAFTRYRKHAGVHSLYMDGTLLYPGFELDELCAYPIGLETYVTRTGDRSILDTPAVREGLAAVERLLVSHRHHGEWLFDTFLLPSDDPAVYPFVLYDNVLAWRALRFMGNAAAAEQVRAAIYRHFVVEGPFGPQFAWATDLQGHHQLYDEPPGSLTLLHAYGFCPPDDPVYQHTVAWVHSPYNPHYFPGEFAAAGSPHARHPWILALANDLLAPDPGLKRKAAQAIARAAMDNGLACESIDAATGLVATGEAFATCAGFLASAIAAFGRPPG